MIDTIARNPIGSAAAVIAIGGAATLVGAWIFQYGFGYQPCPLCFEQRIPYYFVVPLAALVALWARRGAARNALIGGLILIMLVLLWGTYLGVYHAGAEWKWWPGPQDCAGAGFTPGAGGLLQQMQATRVIRCDEAAWRFLGLSLAGYNVLITLALTAIAGIGALLSLRTRETGAASQAAGR